MKDINLFTAQWGALGEYIIKQRLASKKYSFVEHHDADKSGAHSVDFRVNDGRKEFFLEVKTLTYTDLDGVKVFRVKSNLFNGSGYAGSLDTAAREKLPLVLAVVCFEDKCIYWEFDSNLQKPFSEGTVLFPHKTTDAFFFSPKQFTRKEPLSDVEIDLFRRLIETKTLPPELAKEVAEQSKAFAVRASKKQPASQEVCRTYVIIVPNYILPDYITPEYLPFKIDLLRTPKHTAKIFVKLARLSVVFQKEGVAKRVKTATEMLNVETCRLAGERLSNKPSYGNPAVCVDVHDAPEVIEQTLGLYSKSKKANPDNIQRAKIFKQWFIKVVIPYCDALIEQPDLSDSLYFNLLKDFERETIPALE